MLPHITRFELVCCQIRAIMSSDLGTVFKICYDTVLQPHCISNEVMAQAYFPFCHDESLSFRLWVIRVDLALALRVGWLHYCRYRWARVPHAKHLRCVCRGFRYLFICDMSLLLACIVLVSSGCTFTHFSFSVPSSSALLPSCLLCCTCFFDRCIFSPPPNCGSSKGEIVTNPSVA